jgi:uncharacterized protein YeaO (DUF488 family)
MAEKGADMPERPALVREHIEVRRIYDTDVEAGYRILVDRLWPRGVRKEDAHLDEWLKEVAPSAELRRWYGHDPRRFDEFAQRYEAELGRPQAADALRRVHDLARSRRVTLLTATREVARSGAAVLRDHLVSGAG